MAGSHQDHEILIVEGQALPLRLRTHSRARRMSLRVAPDGESLSLVLPPDVSPDQGLAFAAAQEDWIAARLAELPVRVPFAVGSCVPLRGEVLEVRSAPEARRGVWCEDGQILVSGRSEHLARRLRDYLKAEARAQIGPAVRDKAARLGREAGRVSLRDTRSRWGSCSAKGDLSFSWRLILAPPRVLDYVVAHEVAHLAEHNHGARFWRLAGDLALDLAAGRAWLKAHGRDLWRYG